VTKISDWCSVRQWHSSGIYCDYFRAQEFEHQLALYLPGPPGSYAAPGGPSEWHFSAGPAGISPSVTGRCWHCCGLTCTGPTWTRNGAATPRPSCPRQWELLRLVAAGRTYAQIARQLGLSEGTVRIHLQNTYARLQVPSRTAAVTRAFRDLAAT
jgi:DNA-binding CsgD family transcriptional regulator